MNALLRRFALAGCLCVASGALAQAPAGFPTDARGLPTLAPMLSRIAPAVVNIAVTVRAPEENPLLRDPFFRRFFDLPEQRREAQQAAEAREVVHLRQLPQVAAQVGGRVVLEPLDAVRVPSGQGRRREAAAQGVSAPIERARGGGRGRGEQSGGALRVGRGEQRPPKERSAVRGAVRVA